MANTTIKVVRGGVTSAEGGFHQEQREKKKEALIKKTGSNVNALLGLFKKATAIAGFAGGILGLSAYLQAQGKVESQDAISNQYADDSLQEKLKYGLDPVNYEEVITEGGEQLIAVIDERTGEIRDFLTIAEAQAAGLVDSTGELHEALETKNSEFDKMFANANRVGDDVELSKENMDKVLVSSDAQRIMYKQLLEDGKPIQENVDSIMASTTQFISLNDKISGQVDTVITNYGQIIIDQKEILRKQALFRRGLNNLDEGNGKGWNQIDRALEGQTTQEALNAIDIAADNNALSNEPKTIGGPVTPG